MIDKWHGKTQAEKVKLLDEAKKNDTLSSCEVILLRDALEKMIVKQFGYDKSTGNYKNKNDYDEFMKLHIQHNKNLGSLSKSIPEEAPSTEPAPKPIKNVYHIFESVKAETRAQLVEIAGPILEPQKSGEDGSKKLKKIESRADAAALAIPGNVLIMIMFIA